MNPLYPAIADRARHRCEYCLAPEDVFNFAFQVEHIRPQAHGGTDDLDNLALACQSCNAFKSDFQVGHDDETRVDAPLFHPRRDIWTQHFRLAQAEGEIVGISPIGRATVSRLRLNRASQVAARRRWIGWSIYP